MNQHNFFLFCIIASCFGQNSNYWVQRTSMPTARSDLSTVSTGQYIIAAGGCTFQTCPENVNYCSCNNVTDVVEAYSPESNKWFTLSPLPTPRFRHAAVAYDETVVVFGGRDINDNLIQTVDIYSVEENLWVTSPLTWTSATSDLVGVILGTKIYAIGGYDANYASVNQTCTYDLASFSRSAWLCNQVAPLKQGRGDACGASGNGGIYVFGGFSDANFCSALNTVEVYNVASNTWSALPSLHYPRGDSACAFLHNEFHAIAGEVKSNVTNCNQYDIPINDVEHFDVSTNKWIEEAPLAEARFRFSSSVFGDTFYLIGGQTTLNSSTLVQPVLDTVTAYRDVVAETTTSSPSTSSAVRSFEMKFVALVFLLAPILF